MGEVLGWAEGLKMGGQQGPPLWPGPSEGKGRRIGEKGAVTGASVQAWAQVLRADPGPRSEAGATWVVLALWLGPRSQAWAKD